VILSTGDGIGTHFSSSLQAYGWKVGYKEPSRERVPLREVRQLEAFSAERKKQSVFFLLRPEHYDYVKQKRGRRETCSKRLRTVKNESNFSATIHCHLSDVRFRELEQAKNVFPCQILYLNDFHAPFVSRMDCTVASTCVATCAI
jgi:hypothetical protein